MIFLSEFELMHVDEFIDELLHSERVCDIILPRLQVKDKGLLSKSPFSPQDQQTDKYTYIIKHWSSRISGVLLVSNLQIQEKEVGSERKTDKVFEE